MDKNMKEAVAPLRDTVTEIRLKIDAHADEPEVVRPWLLLAAGLYKLEKEMIRPGMRLILDQEETPLPSYDPAKRAHQEGFGQYHPGKLLNQWSAQRNATLAVIDSLPEEEYSRQGRLGDGGQVTLASFLTEWAKNESEALSVVRQGNNPFGL